ncbi:MAG: hypothetical protein R3C28_19100 [Pirellulaceae bacterium]
MSVYRPFLALMVACCSVASVLAAATDDLEKAATWHIPSAQDVRTKLDDWALQNLDENQRMQLDRLWQDIVTSDEILTATVESFALSDSRIRTLIDFCSTPKQDALLPEFSILDEPKFAPEVRHNLKLFVAKWLANHQLFNESQELLHDVQPADVVDPASLLFCKAVSAHRLLQKEDCLQTLKTLNENQDQLPNRYATLARLMEADLTPLQTDSLDEVSRIMSNITTRLELGRAGTRVRKEEESVIAKLDKMIEDLEEQAKQQQQASSSGNAAGSNQPTSPLDRSVAGGQRAKETSIPSD